MPKFPPHALATESTLTTAAREVKYMCAAHITLIRCSVSTDRGRQATDGLRTQTSHADVVRLMTVALLVPPPPPLAPQPPGPLVLRQCVVPSQQCGEDHLGRHMWPLCVAQVALGGWIRHHVLPPHKGCSGRH